MVVADRKRAFIEYIELKVNETIELDAIRYSIKTSDCVDFDELFGRGGRRKKNNRRRTEKRRKFPGRLEFLIRILV